MLASRTAERDLHQAFAQATGAWKSWSSGPWLTDGSVLIRSSFPTEKPFRMELQCNCPADQRDQQHFVEADRSCVFIDEYEEDDHVRSHIEYVLTKGLPSEGTPVTVDEPLFADAEIIGQCPYPVRKVCVADKEWFAVQDRHINEIAKMGRPDAWEYRKYTPENLDASFATVPMLVGLRRGAVVGMAPALPLETSMYLPEYHAKVLRAYMEEHVKGEVSAGRMPSMMGDLLSSDNPISKLLHGMQDLARMMGRNPNEMLAESMFDTGNKSTPRSDEELDQLHGLLTDFIADHQSRKQAKDEGSDG